MLSDLQREILSFPSPPHQSWEWETRCGNTVVLPTTWAPASSGMSGENTHYHWLPVRPGLSSILQAWCARSRDLSSAPLRFWWKQSLILSQTLAFSHRWEQRRWDQPCTTYGYSKFKGHHHSKVGCRSVLQLINVAFIIHCSEAQRKLAGPFSTAKGWRNKVNERSKRLSKQTAGHLEIS